MVTELAVTEQDLTAYNLTIEDIHTYYAGTQPTLVHNCLSLDPPVWVGCWGWLNGGDAFLVWDNSGCIVHFYSVEKGIS